jgi:hypothetical protein
VATRAYSLVRLTLLVLFSFVVVALAAACGRSNIDDYVLTDGGLDGSDGGHCNAQSCPNGCCDQNDQCQGGASLTSCGTDGVSCTDCQAAGFQFCDPGIKSCANRPSRCDSTTCGNGCCESGLCVPGSDPNECGSGGGACQHCAQEGTSCVGHKCQTPTCGPNNCKGCCFGNTCVLGTDNNECGENGQQCINCTSQFMTCFPTGNGGGVCKNTGSCNAQTCAGGCCDQGGLCNMGTSDFQCGVNGQGCQNCAQFGEICRFQTCQPNMGCSPATCPTGCCQGNICVAGGDNTACGAAGQVCKDCTGSGDVCNGMGICIPPPPLCNPGNCSGGCCIGNVCAVGNQDTTCGKGGAQCQNCQSLNEVCTAQTCVIVPPPVCNSTNCAGCCDGAGNCQPGFLNNLCGQNGVSCANCQAMGSTCDSVVTPRVCANQQTTCPAPYPSCPANVTTVPPSVQHVCSTADLANARSACGTGAHGAGCVSFFNFESTQKPACATCLQQFDYDFQELTGILNCASPFVSSACDHVIGCITDCEDKSCAMCDPSAVAQCQSDVRMGQCATYFNQAQCVVAAFMGAGSFCNPANYMGQFGAWLQGVGGHYCGP